MQNWPAVDAFDVELNLCFSDSRRLPGPNRFTRGPAAILTTAGPGAKDPFAHRRWLQVAGSLTAELGWKDCIPRAYPHQKGAELVIPCPHDRLYTATEVNEYAWEAACGVGDLDENFKLPDSGFDVHQRFRDGKEVRAYFFVIDAAEREPLLTAIRETARLRNTPVLADDDELSIGEGAGSRTWPLKSLPALEDIPWSQLAAIPVALVTGSNGKTTTTRLIAAMLEAGSAQYAGRVGLTCTEGVLIGGEWKHRGDYSGPGGARVVLRDGGVAAAVLETARGGILRRGLAMERADVAVVTNVSADHFGEYGVDTLEDLADVKLALAGTLDDSGTLVLNADDPLLLARGKHLAHKLALFAADDAHPALTALRGAEGSGVTGSTCGVTGKTLWLTHGATRTDLGNVDEMPLTLNGAARYNIANVSAAALAANALGVAPKVIAGVLARFGRERTDNPGRLNRWQLGDITAIIDYAHNPDGLGLLLAGSRSLLTQDGKGRIGLLLGQAGNRDNDAIAELARTAAGAQPDFIVLKEIAGMLRGRAVGEVPALLEKNLLAAGYPAEKIQMQSDEVDAARYLIQWARAGDVLVLPVHQSTARKTLAGLLDELERTRWKAGYPLP